MLLCFVFEALALKIYLLDIVAAGDGLILEMAGMLFLFNFEQTIIIRGRRL